MRQSGSIQLYSIVLLSYILLFMIFFLSRSTCTNHHPKLRAHYVHIRWACHSLRPTAAAHLPATTSTKILSSSAAPTASRLDGATLPRRLRRSRALRLCFDQRTKLQRLVLRIPCCTYRCMTTTTTRMVAPVCEAQCALTRWKARPV